MDRSVNVGSDRVAAVRVLRLLVLLSWHTSEADETWITLAVMELKLERNSNCDGQMFVERYHQRRRTTEANRWRTAHLGRSTAVFSSSFTPSRCKQQFSSVAPRFLCCVREQFRFVHDSAFSVVKKCNTAAIVERTGTRQLSFTTLKSCFFNKKMKLIDWSMNCLKSEDWTTANSFNQKKAATDVGCQLV
jgi:hypothetical protein